MLSREEVEQLIDQKLAPLQEEIAMLKAELGKVDLLAIDHRNMRQALTRIETAQDSLKLDFERQEKRLIRFEEQTLRFQEEAMRRFSALQADNATLKEQMALVISMLRRVLPSDQ
ncbi:hypothetical protein KTAU_28230 [Thermogemmatispora aurantia]|jgi:uncharacterized small protein (DUF1192 family)|uniref:hypothetical protein n=1 Tax=Thermogemmatispora aurantia TaxID=2045279 RepID=UPI00124D96AB|nr:hypothetical protein [Thermogemmatispora aurantia]GER84187.1 hypothetical protein KTAU_28230 [Thermogemmatispora aurantia]